MPPHPHFSGASQRALRQIMHSPSEPRQAYGAPVGSGNVGNGIGDRQAHGPGRARRTERQTALDLMSRSMAWVMTVDEQSEARCRALQRYLLPKERISMRCSGGFMCSPGRAPARPVPTARPARGSSGRPPPAWPGSARHLPGRAQCASPAIQGCARSRRSAFR